MLIVQNMSYVSLDRSFKNNSYTEFIVIWQVKCWHSSVEPYVTANAANKANTANTPFCGSSSLSVLLALQSV